MKALPANGGAQKEGRTCTVLTEVGKAPEADGIS